MNTYVDQFNGLVCRSDILNILTPILNLNKEISESMSILKQLKKVLLKKSQFEVFDLCAGNALTSTLIAFLYKNTKVTAIDIRPRDRQWHLINNFTYKTTDINIPLQTDPTREGIIISIHPCRDLAKQVILQFHNTPSIKQMYLMPCCFETVRNKYKFLRSKVGMYRLWVMDLIDLCSEDGIKIRVVEDKFNLSPRNIIIIGTKENKLNENR